jgi:hypothetical protein
MSIEQVDHPIDKYDSDIIGDQIGEAVRSFNPCLTLLDKASWYIVLATTFGGLQLGVEASKIVMDKERVSDKFPLGWESFNVTEEFLEGSIPAVIGAFAGKKVFRLISSKFPEHFPYNKFGEVLFMLAGATGAYQVMVVAGFWIEQHLGIPDIKWGPFK